MFCYDVAFEVAVVQVAGEVCNLETAFLEVFKAVLKKQVTVGFEVNLAVFCEDVLVLVKLCGVSKATLVVFESGPGVAEVDVNSADAVLFGHNLGNFVNIVGNKCNVFAIFVVCREELNNVASCYCKHIADKVNGNVVDVGVLEGFVGNKVTLAAADFKLYGIAAFKKFVPSAFVVAGVFDKEFAGVEFRLCPLLFTHSHIITEKHNILIIYTINR